MSTRPLNRVEALYLRIHDTPDEQAYISIETSDAKHLTSYAWEQYSEKKRLQAENARLREQLKIASTALEYLSHGARTGKSARHLSTMAEDALTQMSVAK